MSGTEFAALEWIVVASYLAHGLAILLAFLRLCRGPTLADRVVASDLIAILTVAFIGVFVIGSGREVYLDVAIALALVAFLGTVAFARYISARAIRENVRHG